jgi:hypothetical protein
MLCKTGTQKTRPLDSQALLPPTDSWEISDGRTVLAKVCARLWSRNLVIEERTADQHDAYSGAREMGAADVDGSLSEFFLHSLQTDELETAKVERGIRGLMGLRAESAC